MRASRWVLTCDPGVDDAVALAVAAGRADCRVEAIVAGAGNVPADAAWRNAAGVAALVGLAVPVGIGSATATDGTTIHREGGGHGTDGLAGLRGRLPAVDGPPPDGSPLVRGQVLATGPLTDCALALRAGRRIERVVWMGGSTPQVVPSPTGAASEIAAADEADVAEFNAAADPAAVDTVLGGQADVDTVLGGQADVAVVPVEITRQVTLRIDDIAPWTSGTAVSRLCADLVAARSAATAGAGATRATTAGATRTTAPHTTGATGTTAAGTTAAHTTGATGTTAAGRAVAGATGIVVHDAVAVIAALEPELFEWSPRRLAASASGRLATLPGSPNAQLAVAVDAAAVRARIVAAVAAATR